MKQIIFGALFGALLSSGYGFSAEGGKKASDEVVSQLILEHTPVVSPLEQIIVSYAQPYIVQINAKEFVNHVEFDAATLSGDDSVEFEFVDRPEIWESVQGADTLIIVNHTELFPYDSIDESVAAPIRAKILAAGIKKVKIVAEDEEYDYASIDRCLDSLKDKENRYTTEIDYRY